MFPKAEHAEKLIAKKVPLEQLNNVTLLYSDIKGFTPLVQSMDPLQLCGYLNKLYSRFDSHLEKYGIYKLDTIGDAFVCVLGASEVKDTGDSDVVKMTKFACHMLDEIAAFKEKTHLDLDMRIGIHKGDVVGGVVGRKKPRYLCWGKDCIIGNKLESDGVPGKIHISSIVKEELVAARADDRLGWRPKIYNDNMSITFQSPMALTMHKERLARVTRESHQGSDADSGASNMNGAANVGPGRVSVQAVQEWVAEWRQEQKIETFTIERTKKGDVKTFGGGTARVDRARGIKIKGRREKSPSLASNYGS